MRGIGVVLVTAGLASTALLAPAAQATTARPSQERSIGLSADGESFTRSLDVPVFDSAAIWVPGDRRAGRIVVRNEAATRADLSLELTTSDALPPWFDLETHDGSTWRTVTSAGTDARSIPLDPGESHRVTLRLTMSGDAPPQAMGVRTGVEIRVRLSETDGSSASAPGDAPGADGALPDTGAGLGPLSLVVGLGLLAAGAGVLRSWRQM